jgi:hypothetical protein
MPDGMAVPARIEESPPLEESAWNERIRKLHGWWQEACRGAGRLPSRKDFDPGALAALLPSVWMLDVAPPEPRFRYRLVGTQIVYALGRDPTGEWLDESPSRGERWFEAAARYRAVVMTRSPAWRKGPPRFEHDARFTMVETIVLPMASDGATVDLLLNASVFFWQDGRALT